MENPVKVSREVFDGLEEIRQSGLTNMFDHGTVQYLAHLGDAHETVMWLEENRLRYIEGVLNGFEVEEEPICDSGPQ